MNKLIRSVLMIVCVAVMIFSAWQIVRIVGNYRESQDSYKALEQYVSFAEKAEDPRESPLPTESLSTEPTENVSEVTAVTEMPDISAWPQVDFGQLSEINDDIVGWIYIEGTNINYPIVQTTDNSYYLKRLFDGRRSGAGCIFLDYRSDADFSDRHSIIYGHHMNDRTMFARLVEYKSQNFYDEHRIAYLVTPTAYYKIGFFSGYVSDISSDAWKLSFHGDEYGKWLEGIQQRSCFVSDCAPTEEDRVITLSTCTYEYNDARFVLHGYIMESIENINPPSE